MSPKQFARQVQDNILNNDLYAARQTYHDWQVGNCTHPQNVRIFDAHSQTYRVIQCACGSCYHCRETKINEWVTRMYAHLEDFKHVYFITLTYRSFVSLESDASRLILDKLAQAVWHYDNYNSTHHASYNPCLLVKSHYQNFMKRLRKNTGYDDITYVLSGEYGHDYGRPHFHVILFSNHEITKQDIVKAWSIRLWRKDNGEFEYCRNQKSGGARVDFPIGRIDYNDLVTNGTLNTTAKVRIDGTYMNAAQCFSYVCKYVCKNDAANFNRVKLAYHSLYHKEKYVKVYNNDIQWQFIHKYLVDAGMVHYRIPELINNLKSYVYEKILFEPNSLVYKGNLQTTFKKSVCGISCDFDFFPQQYFDFRKAFGPFCEFSRGTPIGSVYFTRNISQFTEGVYNRPLLQDSVFVVPTYFRRKAAEYLYGFRFRTKTLKGVSIRLGGLVHLQGRLQDALQNNKPLCRYLQPLCSELDVKAALSDDRFFIVYKNTRYVFDGFTARGYKFNRTSKQFDCESVVPISDFLRRWLYALQQELQRHQQQVKLSEENSRLRESALLLLEECVADRSQLREQFDQQSDYERKHMQIMYNNIHKSVE